MSIKKLTYNLEDADVTLRSDHLQFLPKNTPNSKVNNWAIEILPFRITFAYIKGIKNMLADTISRLIDIDPQIQPEPEPEAYEFGYYTFDPLPTLEVIISGNYLLTMTSYTSSNGKMYFIEIY